MTLNKPSKWLMLALLACPGYGRDLPPIREVPITKLFEFNKLKPKPSDTFYVQKRRYVDTDGMRCVYILDQSNHRILKFSEEGKYLTQIGSIGQNAPDLYYPSALRICGDYLYVADGSGVWIKKYSRDGQYISRIESGVKRDVLDCFDLDQGRLYCGLLKFSRDYGQNKLITVFDTRGQRAAQFGDALKCQNIYAYLDFNSCFFSIVDGNLIGAFANVPVIFKYKTDGEKAYQKDLRQMDLDVIRFISDETAKQKNDPYDTPERMVSAEGWVHYISYCRGFDVDENSEAYYAAWGFNFSPVIYRFNQEGIVQEVIKLKSGDKEVAALGIFINRGLKTKYGVGLNSEGESANRPFFFKF